MDEVKSVNAQPKTSKEFFFRDGMRELSFLREGGHLFVTSHRQFFWVTPFDRSKRKLVPLMNIKKILVPASLLA